MRKQIIIAFAVAGLLGTVLHFLYRWVPNPVIALFVPVNGSVWEQLKLLFWPVLAAGVPLAKLSRDAHKLWSCLLWSLLTMPLLLLGSYYTLHAGFGVGSAAVNAVLYFAALAAGCGLAVRLFEQHDTDPRLGWLMMAAGLYGSALAVFTISAPRLPIFMLPT